MRTDAGVIRSELRDASGAHVATHCRRNGADGGKVVWWEQPDGTKGLGGRAVAELPLYAIDHLEREHVVVVCEGEKATDALRGLGIQAVGTVTGAAGCPGRSALAELNGRVAVLWPDNDAIGREHMSRIAQALAGIAQRVSVVDWSDAPDHGDAADFVAGGTAAHDVLALLQRAVRQEALEDAYMEGESAGAIERTRPTRVSQTSELVALAADVELFHTPDEEPYATLQGDDFISTVELRSREMKGWLRRRYFKAHGAAAGSRAVDEAIDELEAIALYEGAERPVHLRVAEHEGRLYIDLGDRSGRSIEVGGGEWDVIDRPPVRFRRSGSMHALPEPVRGGSIEELRPFVNVADDSGFRILVGYILAAYRPVGPYPVLVIRAEQGAAKTATARVVRALIDPARSPEIGVPSDREALLVAARHHHVTSIDNVSSLPNWLSDDLARLATGAGVALRVKYSTLDELSLYLCGPLILNGIEDFVARADLADRSWVVELPALADDRKRDEEEFAAAFSAAEPRILGAVLDGIAGARQAVDRVHETPATRMINAARLVMAAEDVFGWPSGAFAADLAEMKAGSRDSALEASPLSAPLRKLAEQSGFSGTADELRIELETLVDERTRSRADWPKTARKLSGDLRRLVPDLRSAGIGVLFGRREPHTRRRLISVSEVGVRTFPTVPTVPAATPPSALAPHGAAGLSASAIANGGDGGGRLPSRHRPGPIVLGERAGNGGDGHLSLFDHEGGEMGSGAQRDAREVSLDEPGMG